MGGMFSQPKPSGGGATTIVQNPAAPAVKPVRMPTMDDPTVVAAADRARSAALKRKGRLSTIMSDRTKSVGNPAPVAAGNGSSGRSLGA